MRTWLVSIRMHQKKSQYEVALEAGMSQSYYASIETGVRGNKLPVKTAKKIAQALCFDWQQFYESEEEKD